MDGSVTATAFYMGLVSALSLPLGAITALYWKPGDRTGAALVAFGGGALLAALTIDLVAPAFARGQYYPLASGCIAGGLLFFALNEILNDYGGFLRSVSATIYHLRRREHQRYKRILSNLGRIDIFQHLANDDFKRLAYAIQSRRYSKGDAVYQLGDPSDALYIVSSGEIELLDPQQDMRRFELLRYGSAFGRMALLTGMPHKTLAVAATDADVWVLPRGDLDYLLEGSSELRQAVHRLLRGEEVTAYLQNRQMMDQGKAEKWSDMAVDYLGHHGRLPPLARPERREVEFSAAAQQIQRTRLLSNLPPESVRNVASRLLYRKFKRGDTLFQRGDQADRMYIIEHGEVSLIHVDEPSSRHTILHKNDAFGGMAFLTGARHTSAAIATRKTAVWMLRKEDFVELLEVDTELERRVRSYLEDSEVADYLERKQHFDFDRASRWVSTAIRNMDTGKLIPAAEEMAARLRTTKGAPLAIWLGIMLDGIPESLVIGASLIYHDISLALLAGLFLSNYPEALFSSLGLRQQGFSVSRVITMWTSLMLFTGIGAALGSLLFTGADHFTISIMEGLAAGAMLTMISQTMLPEAYFKGGSIIGLATLAGFLTTLFFKTIG
jgi:CRP-like cAMP-binding protein